MHGFQVGLPPGILLINQPLRQAPLPESDHLEIQPLFQAPISVGIHLPTQQHRQYEEILSRFVPPRQPVGDINYFACLVAE